MSIFLRRAVVESLLERKIGLSSRGDGATMASAAIGATMGLHVNLGQWETAMTMCQ